MTDDTIPAATEAGEENASDVHWPAYDEVTAERPPWTTTTSAVDAFGPHPSRGPRLAVDLGCGAGRDTRELLRRGLRLISLRGARGASSAILSPVFRDEELRSMFVAAAAGCQQRRCVQPPSFAWSCAWW